MRVIYGASGLWYNFFPSKNPSPPTPDQRRHTHTYININLPLIIYKLNYVYAYTFCIYAWRVENWKIIRSVTLSGLKKKKKSSITVFFSSFFRPFSFCFIFLSFRPSRPRKNKCQLFSQTSQPFTRHFQTHSIFIYNIFIFPENNIIIVRAISSQKHII